MVRSEHLCLLFATLLAELALGGCSCTGFRGCPESLPEVTAVDPADLATALEDGALSQDECRALCKGQPLPDAGSSSTSTTGPDNDSTDGSGTAGTTETAGATETASTSPTTTTDTTGSSASVGGSATSGIYDDFLGCEVIEGESAKVGCNYEDYCIGGRRPAGLISEGRGAGESPLARWLAEAAHLEAASVPAFERLAAELQEHGAPPELVAAASSAADDERRHAELVTALALRAGGQPSPLEIAAAEARPLIALALENAVEGCVGETWAALLATHQGEAAEDPEIRACMAKIAADEARHAALAWAIDAWIHPLLTPEERARVEHARRSAALALRGSPVPAADLIDRAGLPLPAAAERLWRGLDAALWRSAA